MQRGSFGHIRPYVGGAEPPQRYGSFLVDGIEFAAAVWIGPAATRTHQRAIWRVVRSLRFPRLREGTIWQNTYYVLGPASRYPLGSVTLFRRSALPHDPSLFRLSGGFYLAHFTPASHSLAPYAQPIYGIEQVFTSPEPPHPTCKVAFDRKDLQFFCPGTDLRWDRTGEAIAAHAGSANWELFALRVTKAEDGNLLITP